MTYTLESAPNARLRKGFDAMKCHGGAYRLDSASGADSTARFHVLVEGTDDRAYGDVSVPKGYLYFSLPSFKT